MKGFALLPLNFLSTHYNMNSKTDETDITSANK